MALLLALLRRVPPLLAVVVVATLLATWQIAAPNQFPFQRATSVNTETSRPFNVSGDCPPHPTTTPVVNQAEPSSSDFVMRVTLVMGGGDTCLPSGKIGQSKRVDLFGERVRGTPLAPGATVTLGRNHQEPLTVRVTTSKVSPDGRVQVALDPIDMREVIDTYALSSDPAALGMIAAPTPVPGQPTAADDYTDYNGPPLRYTSQPVEDVDVEILIQLDRLPYVQEAASLERAIRAWDNKGMTDGFGTAPFLGEAGHLHGLYTDGEFGPRWTGATLRWLEDFGAADARVAMNDLARRLAGWSAEHGIPVVRLHFGPYGTR